MSQTQYQETCSKDILAHKQELRVASKLYHNLSVSQVFMAAHSQGRRTWCQPNLSVRLGKEIREVFALEKYARKNIFR